MNKLKTETEKWTALHNENRNTFLKGLSQRLVVVSNKISFIGHSYKSTEKSNQLDTQSNADDKTHSVTVIFLDKEAQQYKELQSHISECRKWFTATTSPYLSGGIGLVPTDQYQKWSQENIKRRDRFESLVSKLLGSWVELTEGSSIKSKLGSAFDPSKIPHVDTVSEKISWEHTATPLGDAFNSKNSLISQELLDVYSRTTQKTVTDYVSNQYSNLVNVFETLSDSLNHRREGIEKDLGGNKSRVSTQRLTDAHNSLRDLIDNNITECSAVDKIYDIGKQILSKVTVDDAKTIKVTDNVSQLSSALTQSETLIDTINQAKVRELDDLRHAFG
jgi:hypothetical protein